MLLAHGLGFWDDGVRAERALKKCSNNKNSTICTCYYGISEVSALREYYTSGAHTHIASRKIPLRLEIYRKNTQGKCRGNFLCVNNYFFFFRGSWVKVGRQMCLCMVHSSYSTVMYFNDFFMLKRITFMKFCVQGVTFYQNIFEGFRTLNFYDLVR